MAAAPQRQSRVGSLRFVQRSERGREAIARKIHCCPDDCPAVWLERTRARRSRWSRTNSARAFGSKRDLLSWDVERSKRFSRLAGNRSRHFESGPGRAVHIPRYHDRRTNGPPRSPARIERIDSLSYELRSQRTSAVDRWLGSGTFSKLH